MTLDYRNPTHNAVKGSKGWWTLFIGIGCSLVVLILLALVLLPSLGRARENANRIKCASNLRQIGQAVQIYANDHGGQFPPDLLALYQHLGGDLTPDVFTCPSSDVWQATGATTQQITAAMLAGDHFSYAWAGSGVTDNSSADVVIAFDLERHDPRDGVKTIGINVLLKDGSVTFVDEPTAKQVWAQFVAGVRPIYLPSPTSAPAAPISTSPSR